MLGRFTRPMQPVAQEDDVRNWVVVKEWTGETGQLRTENFPSPGPVWRVSFKSIAGEAFGVLDTSVRTRDGALVTGAYGKQGDEKGLVSGSFTVRAGHKEYYLLIDSHGLQWAVAVERPE